MTVSATITNSWSSGGTIRTGTITRSAGLLNRYAEVVPGGSTDLEIACVIDVSELEGLYIKCDRALTIETNDGTTPDDTITLVAGEPLAWASGNNITCPLGTDVTSIFVTLAAGDDATLEMEVLVDPTP
jgi:hypothetical protein